MQKKKEKETSITTKNKAHHRPNTALSVLQIGKTKL
jgi:hypothetical protein